MYFNQSDLLGRLCAPFLLGNGILQCIAFLFHLVSTIGARASRDEIPATGERRKQGKEQTKANHFLNFHYSLRTKK